MRRTLLLTAAAAGAALLSCAPRTTPQATNLGTPNTQPQPGGSVSAGSGAPISALPAAPTRAQQRGGTGGSSARGGPAAPGGTTQGVPGGLIAGPSLGENTRGGAMMSGAPNYAPGPSSSSMIGGEPARVGGAPPGDTSRPPGSSGISGAGVGNTGGIGGPIR
jgi:hypothetical protein